MEDTFRKLLATARGMWQYRTPALLVAWLVGLAAMAAIISMPSRYEAAARIFVNTDSILKPLMTGLTVMPNEEQRIVMLSRVVVSRPNVEKLVTAVGLDHEAPSREGRERVVDAAMKRVEFKGSSRDNIYTLSFRDEDPARAQSAVEYLASLFMESGKGGKAQDTKAAKQFIEEQIAIYEKKLQEAEDRLKQFKLRHINNAPDGAKDYFGRMAETEKLLSQARLELREAERARDAFKRGLASEAAAPAAVNHPQSATLADVEGRIDAMNRNLDGLVLKYTENHPDIQWARRVLAELQEQRRRLVESGVSISREPPPGLAAMGPARAAESMKVSLAQSEAAVASLSARVAEYSTRYESLRASAALLPQLEAELAQLNRDYEVNKKQYESLAARRESANISGEMQTVAGVSDFRLVDPPRVSPRPVSPNRRAMLPLALLAALAAGIGFAYLAWEIRPTFHDSRTLREVTGLPLAGIVSRVADDALLASERRSRWRFAGALAALPIFYVAGFIVLEVMSVRVA